MRIGIGGTYGVLGEVITVWLTGDTIIARDGESVWTGRAGDLGASVGVVGITRLFDDPIEEIRVLSSGEGTSSICFRFLDDGGGCGVDPEDMLWRCCVDGGLAGVAIVPHLDQGGGGGRCASAGGVP